MAKKHPRSDFPTPQAAPRAATPLERLLVSMGFAERSAARRWLLDLGLAPEKSFKLLESQGRIPPGMGESEFLPLAAEIMGSA